VPLGDRVSTLVLSLVVASLLPAVAVWERRTPGVQPVARAL
jgi:predicted small integral membrane protein